MLHRDCLLPPASLCAGISDLTGKVRSISLKETLINFPFPAINRGIPETIAEDQEDDPSKDTLPSRDKVAIILEMIESLSVEETHSLVQEMVKSPELVNFVLKAIASQIFSNK